MKFDSIFVGIIIMLVIFIPVAYMIISAGGKDKKVKKSMSKIAQAKGLNLNNIDIIGNLVIGVDENSKTLVYSSKASLDRDYKIVPLSEVKDCRTKTVKESDKNLQWVGLEIMENQGKREIQFYCEVDENCTTKDPYVCLQDAKRWENTLRPLLRKAA